MSTVRDGRNDPDVVEQKLRARLEAVVAHGSPTVLLFTEQLEVLLGRIDELRGELSGLCQTARQSCIATYACGDLRREVERVEMLLDARKEAV